MTLPKEIVRNTMEKQLLVQGHCDKQLYICENNYEHIINFLDNFH